MEEIPVEMEEEDFEFAKPPISMDLIKRVFERYNLKFIAYFQSGIFHVEDMDGDIFLPLHENGSYPADLELVLDFMVKERFRMIRYDDGILFKSLIRGRRAGDDEI